MKKITRVLSAVLTVACFTGAASLAGCKNTPDNRTAASANWNVKCSSSYENAFIEDWMKNVEEANYAITFTEGSNNTYKFVLDSKTVGTGEEQKTVIDGDKSYYKTTFSMEEYDWANTDIPEGYAPAEPAKENVYVYTTTLKLTGKYVITATEEEYPFVNERTTVTKFRTAKNYLTPVYSKHEVNTVSPSALTAPNVKDDRNKDRITKTLHADYETYYCHDLSKVMVTTTDYTAETPEPKDAEITLYNQDNYSIYDNASIRAVIRGMSQSSAHSFYVFSPQNGNLQLCTSNVGLTAELNPAGSTELDPIQTDIVAALTNAPDDYIFFDGDGGETRVNPRYTAISVAINADMSGQSMTQWYATVENQSLNTTRCVMLAWSDPLPFGLGQINYHLKSLDFKAKA